MKYLIVFIAIFSIACTSKAQPSGKVSIQPTEVKIPEIQPIEKSADEWKNQLTAMEFYVLREAGTERAFTGDLLESKGAGVYTCAACQLPLFDAATKYTSGTGWPSYYQPIAEEVVEEDVDYHLGYARREVHCARCKGHLGHVFGDGPKPTGLRYCINSVSLDFVKAEEVE